MRWKKKKNLKNISNVCKANGPMNHKISSGKGKFISLQQKTPVNTHLKICASLYFSLILKIISNPSIRQTQADLKGPLSCYMLIMNAHRNRQKISKSRQKHIYCKGNLPKEISSLAWIWRKIFYRKPLKYREVWQEKWNTQWYRVKSMNLRSRNDWIWKEELKKTLYSVCARVYW